MPIMDRHVTLYRRQMQDQILASFPAAKRPGKIGDHLPITLRSGDQEWTERVQAYRWHG